MVYGALLWLSTGPERVKKSPVFLTFFPNSWEILVDLLHTCYTFEFVFNYLQLLRVYAILSATTQRAFRPMVDILSMM